MGYSGAGGKLIHEKTQNHKISWHCPSNCMNFYEVGDGKIQDPVRKF